MSTLTAVRPEARRVRPGAPVIRRVGQVIIGLWLAYTLSFVLFQLLPSDPVQVMIGPENTVDEEQRDALRHELGLDRHVAVRYFDGLIAAVTGDLGTSYRSGRAVTAMIGDALGPTAALAVCALALALPVGVCLAITTATIRRRWAREILLAMPPIAQSLPTFWVGLLLLQFFAFTLGWAPAGGSAPAATVLPAITLAIPAAALIMQTLSIGLLGEAAQPYAIAASARGYRPWRVVMRHTFRNAIAPTLVVTGMLVGWLLAGAVIVETVFARDGLGRLVQHAVSTQDLPVLQGVVILSALVFLVLAALVEVLHAAIDPRVRSSAPTVTEAP